MEHGTGTGLDAEEDLLLVHREKDQPIENKSNAADVEGLEDGREENRRELR
jgi:hypothetical protein